MSNGRHSSHDASQFSDDESIAELEARIREAARYIQPSERLRGRVVGGAKQWAADRRGDRVLFRGSLAVAMGLLCLMITIQRLEAWWINHPAVVSSVRIEARAAQLADQQHLQANESVAEAYRQWRESLAAKWWANRP